MENYSSREAVRVIRGEHDRLKAVIYGMLHFARTLASGNMTVEYTLRMRSPFSFKFFE